MASTTAQTSTSSNDSIPIESNGEQDAEFKASILGKRSWSDSQTGPCSHLLKCTKKWHLPSSTTESRDDEVYTKEEEDVRCCAKRRRSSSFDSQDEAGLSLSSAENNTTLGDHSAPMQSLDSQYNPEEECNECWQDELCGDLEDLPSSGSEETMALLEKAKTLVTACLQEGDVMMARVHLQEAMPTAVRAVEEGICSPSYLAQHFLAQLADTCHQLGDCSEAIEHYTSAAQQERSVTEHSTRLMGYLDAICRIYVEVRQYNYALCVFKEIYDIQIDALGPNSLDVASTLCNIALMHFMLEFYTPSLHFYQETLRISLTLLEEYNAKRTSDPDHTDEPKAYALNMGVGDSLNAMGLLYFKLRRFEEAAGAFSCSLGIREKLLGPYHRDVTILWYNLAMVWVETGDLPRAIPLYEEGIRRERIGLGGDPLHPALSSTLQYLGEIYNQSGEIDQSLQCFQQALAIEKRQALLQGTSPKKNRNSKINHWTGVCRLLNVIGNIHLMQANIPATMKCFVEAARTASLLLACGNQYIPLVVAGHMFCHLTRLYPSCASAA